MTDPTLSVAVMAIPSRRSQTQVLVARLHEQAQRLHGRIRTIGVSEDMTMSGTCVAAANAWEMADATATHHMVVQDDVVIPTEFLRIALDCLRDKPGVPVSFFSHTRYRFKHTTNPTWGVTSSLLGSQAVAMPVPMALEAARNIRPVSGLHDDRALSAFFCGTGRRVYVTVPSIVQHDTKAISSIGHLEPLVAEHVAAIHQGLTWHGAPTRYEGDV